MASDGRTDCFRKLNEDQSPCTKLSEMKLDYGKSILSCSIVHNTFIRNLEDIIHLASFCPECGGELKFDPNSKNFICKSCGIFASREKIEELRDKAENTSINKKRQLHDDYLDWWQASKKEKQKQ
jgi:tRNA(Ile2) C34 agmatinyltransferase TiaS